MVSGWQTVPGFRWLADLVRGLLARRWVRFGIVGGAASVSYFLLGLLFVNVAGLPTLAGNALAYARAGADLLVSSAPYFAPPAEVQVRIDPVDAA